ncbi:MAG: histidine kinase [Acidobacteriota bacterium]|nr:histidine kinase [Acidobacteriota bacterium]
MSPLPQPLLLLSLLVFSFGAFAYGAMLAFWLLSPDRGKWTGQRSLPQGPRHVRAVSGAITICSFIWFLVNIVAVIDESSGHAASLPRLISALLALSFPPLIAHTVLHSISERDTVSRRWTWFLALIYPASLASSGAILLHVWDVIELPRAFFDSLGMIIGGLFASVSIYAMLLMRASRRRAGARPRHARRPRAFSRWMNALFVFSLAAFVVMSVLARAGEGLAWAAATLLIFAQSLPLAFLAVGTYYESRFDFFDVLVKRGLALVSTVTVVTLALAAIIPATASVHPSLRPWVQALLLSPLALLLPPFYRRAGAWLDARWLGRQFPTVDALRHLIAGMSGASSETDLVSRAEARLAEISGAPVVITLGADTPVDPGGARVSPGGDASWPAFHARADVVTLPVTHGGAVVASAVFGERESRRPYFSQDRRLFALMLDVFGHFLATARLQERRKAEDVRAGHLSLRASEAELKALRAQINPHFLFNALNAIAGLIPRDPERADQAIEQLADVFRYTLSRSESDWSTVEEELAFARAYLRVEEARFGEKLVFSIEADPAALPLRVPTLMLQTLVENAMKHGIAALRVPGAVAITVALDGTTLTMDVTDTGPGIDAPAAPGSGYGLRNVRDRLKAHFDGRASFTLARDEAAARTRARIIMPATGAAERTP